MPKIPLTILAIGIVADLFQVAARTAVVVGVVALLLDAV